MDQRGGAMSKFIIFERIQGAEGESGEAFMKRINKFFQRTVDGK